jgi:16S rRNA (cytosine967-C5)-methyltransferase
MTDLSATAVRLATAALPTPPTTIPPRLERAARPGLVRNVTTELWQQIRADPLAAGRLLSQRLRRDRSLGSKGRRTTSAVIYGLIRHGEVLRLLVDRIGGDPANAHHLYLTWLVLGDGLDPALAHEQDPGLDFARLDDAHGLVAEHATGLAPAEALALGGSLPLWLAETWWRELGTEAAALIAAFAERPPMAARANQSRIDRDSLAARLAGEGVNARPGRLAPHALIFEDRRNIHILPSFREGLFEVQDEGSQLLAALAEPAPGARIVDFCAGAGGKALALADAGAQVLALDVRDGALRVLERRMARAGQSIRYEIMAARGPVPVEPGWADTVLVDAPCSSSGVLRRRPEMRWRLTPAWVEDRARLQRAILDRAAPCVRPGARLVYGTCSLLEEENQAVIRDFLLAHPDFETVERLGDDGVLWPHRTGTDGFFGVAMVRRTP